MADKKEDVANFVRRIGVDREPDNCTGDPGCPDIWELDNGNFAVIGREATEALKTRLPDDASCGANEKIVEIDRHILINAKSFIPSE